MKCEVRIKIFFFFFFPSFWKWISIVLASLVEKIILSILNHFGTLIKNHWLFMRGVHLDSSFDLDICIYRNSTLFKNCYSLILSHGTGQYKFSNLVLHLCICMATLNHLNFHTDFRISLSIFGQKLAETDLDCNDDCNDSPDLHLKNTVF